MSTRMHAGRLVGAAVIAVAAYASVGNPADANTTGWQGFAQQNLPTSLPIDDSPGWGLAITEDLGGPGVDVWNNNHGNQSEAIVDLGLANEAVFNAIDYGAPIVPGPDTHGVAFSDIDGDGDEDLFEVTGRNNTNRLFRNDNGTLQHVAPGELADFFGRGRQPIFFDFENDGDMDVLITNLDLRSDPVPLGERQLKPSEVYLNNGDGTVWSKVPDPNEVISDGHVRIGQLTSTGPGTPNILVTHDVFNLAKDSVAVGVGTMSEPTNPAIPRRTLGMPIREVLVGDFDGDLHPEFIVFNGSESQSAGQWPVTAYEVTDAGNVRTVSLPRSSDLDNCRSGAAADFDNDGDLDILAGCAQRQEGQNRNVVLVNDGLGNFSDAGIAVLPAAIAETPGAIVTADINADGWMDAVVANGYDFDRAVDHVLMNSGGTGHWLSLDLVGANPDAMGAVAYVGTDKWQVREMGHRYHRSQDGRTLHFGLGAATDVAQVLVRWADGTYAECSVDGVDRRVQLAKDGAACETIAKSDFLATLADTPGGGGSAILPSSSYIAPTAGTYIPVYDTAWQMFGQATVEEANEYFAALKANGFTGTWSGVIHHAPATYAHSYRGGGQMGSINGNGELVLSPGYVQRVNDILDAAHVHGMKVGMVAAWQNLYLPGGGADSGNPISDQVRGTVTTNNAYAYGQHLVESFGDHPALSMWVFGGDAGTNNTEANKAVWREMAAAVRDAGSQLEITYHTPTSPFDQLNYAGEPWLNFIAPETGHGQDAAETEAELRAAAQAYQLPVWQGEPRYFNINFTWVPAAYRNPGVAEVEADAIAARNAGVAGYVYGDAGRWHWCQNFGDSSPCDRTNIAASFGGGEEAVIAVFRDPCNDCGGGGGDPEPGDGVVFNIEGRGVAGTERLAVRVNGQLIQTLAFGQQTSVESVELPQGTDWTDIRLQFLDSVGEDLTLVAFSLGGESRAMVAGDVLVSGQWTGTACSLLGPPIGSTIQCSGFVEFPEIATPQPDVTAPVVSSVVPVDGAVVERDSPLDVVAEVSDAGAGVDRVRVLVRRNSTGEYWDGSSWVSSWSWVLATDGGAGSWSVRNVDVSEASSYRVLVWAWDVEGNLANWSDHVSPIFEVLEADVTAPVVSSVVPVDGAIITAPQLDVVAEVSDVGSGVDRVRVFVRRDSTGEYWDGSSWVSSWSWVLADLTPAGWVVRDVDVSEASSYRVLVWAWDVEGNLANWSDHVSPIFEVLEADVTAPVVSSVVPVDGAVVERDLPLGVVAEVSDVGSGVDRVRVLVRNQQTGQYWNGTSWVPSWSWVLATGDGAGSWSVRNVDVSDASSYRVLVWAWDVEGNLATWSDNPSPTFDSDEIG